MLLEAQKIYFQFPNVTDILYPTAWVDELPFLLAPQEQNAWAVTNNVNFLASGYHAPDKMGENEILFTAHKCITKF